MKVYEFCIWVMEGNSIVLPPLKGSPGNSFQLSAVLLLAPTNNKTGNVLVVARGGSVRVFVLDGGEEEAKVDKKEDGGDGLVLWDACANWFEVFPLTIKGKANLSV